LLFIVFSAHKVSKNNRINKGFAVKICTMPLISLIYRVFGHKKRRLRKWQTPQPGIAIAARGDCQRRTRRFASPYSPIKKTIQITKKQEVQQHLLLSLSN
jgi:hypothetical protein